MIEGGGEYRIWKGQRGPLAKPLGVNKSGVETFEWRLITLVSVAWNLLLSQEIFYQYSNGELREFKEKNPAFPKSNSRLRQPELLAHSFLGDSDRVCHPPRYDSL